MTLPPLRRQVLVPCDPSTAYQLFVDDIGAWWPLARYSRFGDGGSVAFDGTRFVETGPSGDTAVWGTIIEARPPDMVSFAWHPGGDPDLATQVAVTFAPASDPGVTLVTLVHSGWEAHADPITARDEYSDGWITVLDRFTAAAG